MEEASFQLFLTFVYSGILETDKMSMEEIIEMLAIADRYEVCTCHTRVVHFVIMCLHRRWYPSNCTVNKY